MNYAKIIKCDVANGTGFRVTLFLTGCPLHCKGCFNPKLQDPNYGKQFTYDTYQQIKEATNEHIAGLSILGGEPLAPYNVTQTYELCERFKQDFPNKTIWLWTGYTYEELQERITTIQELQNYPFVLTDVRLQGESAFNILQLIDVLVDGRFVEEQKDLNLPWCGSSNQKVIDMKKTLAEKRIILYQQE